MDKRRTTRTWHPSALLMILIAMTVLAAACSNSPVSSTPSTNEEPAEDIERSDGTSDDADVGSAVSEASLAAVQGRWLLTEASGFEESHGSTITITDGPELGDRYIELQMHSTCISIFDYAINGTTLKTKVYLGDVPMESCIEPAPAFAALFELNSELELAAAEDTLELAAEGHTLGLVRIGRSVEVPRAPVAIRDSSGEDGFMEALFIGTLETDGLCTYGVTEGGSSPDDRLLVVFSSQRAKWDYENNVLLADDGSGTFVELADGDRIELGGGSVQIDIQATPWVIPPAYDCDTTWVWFAS